MAHHDWSKKILFYVNGERHQVENPNPNTTLANYLRRKLHLTGTKIACGEGGCGACCVLVSHYDHENHVIRNRSVNACLFPLIQADGCAIVTVEGIGNNHEDVLHLIQKRFREFGASQCGFCTPGFVMSLYALLRNNPHPSLEEIQRSLDGNLCRCTGYRSIFAAAQTFARIPYQDTEYEPSSSSSGGCSEGDNCCMKKGNNKGNDCGNDCCQKTSVHSISPPTTIVDENGKVVDTHSRAHIVGNHVYTLNGQKHPLFPAELRRYDPAERPLYVESKPQSGVERGETQTHYFRPTTLQELLALRKKFEGEKHLRIICGNTELGIETKFKKYEHYRYYIEALRVKELLVKKINYAEESISHENSSSNGLLTGKSIEIGASVTLTNMLNFFKEAMESLPSYQCNGLKAVCEQIERFASTSIRNAASLGGNVVTASPISDLNPIWIALGASLNLINCDQEKRTVPFSEFFLGYRKVDLRDDEILVSITIPLFQPNDFPKGTIQIVQSYKQAKRREDDIAIVNAGMSMVVEKETGKIHTCQLAFGGMAVKTVTASKTVQYLTGNTLSNETCQKAIELLQQDLPLPQNVPGGMSEYRRTLTLSFFYKFYVQLVKDCSLRKLTEEEESVLLSSFHKPYPIGHQYYQPKEVGTAVGKPIPHNYSHLQVTGEATYVQDIPPQSRELYAYPVLSNKPYAKIKKVDPSRALTFEGVVSWVDWRDVKGSNRVGAVIHDEEELFLTTETTAVGQLIGFILAETHLKAMVAAKAVHVEYEENENPILSIDDALQKGAPVLIERKMFRGDSVAKFEELSNNEDIEIIEGDIKIGGQEHFYFETQSCLILPGKYGLSGDEGEVVVFSSTQSPSHTQSMVASVLGIPDNKVITKLKRLGGGFGGKESRSCILAAAAAVAAKKVNRPVRCILDRDIDMAHTGQRHPCYAKYKIAINKKTLKFEAIHTDIYLNGGYSLDFSKGVLERALYSFDNVYYMPHVTVIGKAFKTNLPTNTAFRGFGGPQGLMVCETIVEHVSHALSVKYPQLNSDKSQLCNDIRQINMYTEHNAITPYKQLIGDVHRIRLMWERIHEITNYPQRLKQVNEYNKKHKYQKRGISLIPTKFAISFGVTFLNQATALVNIYSHDGSVYISHAGCEMGQGVHIKVAQCAATSLGIPLDLIHVGETSTDKAPNTSATAASVGSDLNGFATKNACEKINENLSKLKKELFPELYMEHNLNDLNYVPILTHDQWRKLVKTAYLNCIPLSSTGFYKTPNLCMDWDKCEGTPFSYFTYGVACSEVQIDTLTGDWSVLRTDIVMDVGDSLNPTIDIGQIEGAFIQGMGYYTMEELIFGDSAHPWVQAGHLFTKGPGNYKIPSGNDLPDEFNVHLLRDDMERPFPSSVYSSKGIGEPPLFLASSVLFAIRHAIFDLRKQMGLNDYFVLDSPATTERIRMLCSDQFTNYFNKEQCFRAKGSF